MKTDPRLFFYASIIFLSVGGILGAWNDVWRFALGVLLHIRPMKAQTEQRICRVSQIFGDILFCLLAGISVVVLLFYFSDGKIRGFAFAAMASGFWLYRCTLGRLFGKASTWLSRQMGRAINRMVFYMVYPLYRLLIWVCHVLSVPIMVCRNKIKQRRMIRYDAVCRQMLNEKSKKGFVNI